MDSVFFVFEMIGVVAFALSGAMWAIRQEMDVLGVCVLGATTAVGGGIVRDLMLGITPPTMLVNPTAALIFTTILTPRTAPWCPLSPWILNSSMAQKAGLLLIPAQVSVRSGVLCTAQTR